MPISPRTPPGTHVVVTWVTDSLEEYVHRVILPQYRVQFIDICRKMGFVKSSLALGQRFVLSDVKPCLGAQSGFMCTIDGGDPIGYALEHFDVAQLPKAITDLLQSKPADRLETLRDVFFEAAGIKRDENLRGLHRW